MTFEQETAAAIELLTSICERLANAVTTLQGEQAELRDELHALEGRWVFSGSEGRDAGHSVKV